MAKLPESAFFTVEEKVQLLSGDCPRNITKDRLKEWLSYRKGSSKDGSARSEATKKELVQRYILNLEKLLDMRENMKYLQELYHFRFIQGRQLHKKWLERRICGQIEAICFSEVVAK